MFDNNPSIFITWWKWRGSTLQPLVESDSGGRCSARAVGGFGFEEEVAQVELVVCTFVFAVAVEHVPSEFLEERVMCVDFLVLKHGDHRTFAGFAAVVESLENLRLNHGLLAVDGMVTLVVQDDMGGSVHVANLRGHQAETFVLVFGLQRDVVLLNHHFPICLPELDGGAGVDLRQLFYWRQVDGRLVLTVPAAALPVGTQIVIIPVHVAPRRRHRQDPLRLDDVELARQLRHRTPRLRRLRFALARHAHRLLDRALPFLLLCCTRST